MAPRERRRRGGSLRAAARTFLGALALAAGACVSGPSVDALLAVGFREPEQTFETYRTALRADRPGLEYRCLAVSFLREQGISQLGYREFRDALFRRQPFLRLVLVRAEVRELRFLGDHEAVLLASAGPRTVQVRLVREDFYEKYVGREVVEDGYLEGGLGRHLSELEDPGGDWILAYAPRGSTTDADSLTELRVASEWKIAGFELLAEEEAAGAEPPPGPDARVGPAPAGAPLDPP